MSQFILDIQGFKNEKKRFIVKEIAIISTNGKLITHCFVKPPYSFKKLSKIYQNHAKFNSDYYHGIPWYMGDTNFNFIITLLNKLPKYCTVYVKGLEKALFLQELLLTINVVDLGENLQFPSLKKLTSTDQLCDFHKYTGYMCACNNVYNILYQMKK